MIIPQEYLRLRVFHIYKCNAIHTLPNTIYRYLLRNQDKEHTYLNFNFNENDFLYYLSKNKTNKLLNNIINYIEGET